MKRPRRRLARDKVPVRPARPRRATATPTAPAQPASELDDLLSAYGSLDGSPRDVNSVPRLVPTTSWRGDAVVHRETVLRPSLERIAWKADEWGHQLRVEDGSPEHKGNPGDDQGPKGVELFFASCETDGAGDLGALRFEPDVSQQRVMVSRRPPGRDASFEPDGSYTLKELTVAKIFELAATWVRQSLFASDTPLPPFEELAAPSSIGGPVNVPPPERKAGDVTRTRLPFIYAGKSVGDAWRQRKGGLNAA